MGLYMCFDNVELVPLFDNRAVDKIILFQPVEKPGLPI